MDSAAIVEFLKQTELFGGVPDNVLGMLAPAFQSRHLRPNSLVFDQGDQATSLFLVVRGGVELRRRDTLTGVELLLSLYGETKSFGEEGVLTGDPSPVFAVTVDDTELLVMTKEAFGQTLQKLPMVGVAGLRIVSRRGNRLAADKGIRFINLSKLNIDTRVFLELPRRTIVDHNVIPIARRGKTLTLAMVNPHDLVAYDEVRRILRETYIEPVGVAQPDFEKLLNKMILPTFNSVETTGSTEHAILPKFQSRDYSLKFQQEGTDAIADEEKTAVAPGEQVVQLLNQVIGDGLSVDCSDIHIEPQEREIVIRYRVDGRLWRRQEETQSRFHGALCSRLKALARMDITERRKPQDGRVGLNFNGREVALRISTVPTRTGEKIVMRVLDKSQGLIGLDRIITIPAIREMVRSMIFQPHGIVCITGPTGSGKTTTMYSAMLERKADGVNIVTIEDPIEYAIPGITQVQYNEGIGLGYAEAIKAFLRQDTDVMLIGETRDARTAQYAMQAALSGHLVVTSLHTNNALSTVYRLREMGIEQFLIANALTGVVAQRLVRKICQDCRESVDVDPKVAATVFDLSTEHPQFFRGRGCPSCNNSGYRGRVGIFEVLRMGEEIRSAMGAGATMAELKEIGVRHGMVTLKEYSKYVLTRGMTTMQEVARVLYSEEDGTGPSKNRKCPTCGFTNSPDNKFCEECGTAMT